MSHVKSTLMCLALVALALLSVLLGPYFLPNVIGLALAGIALLVALGAATLAWSGAIVLARCKRSLLGQQDLFLELNRSREPHAIKATAPARVTRIRRWFARRLLGHGLVVGDVVEIKTWVEIRATLDDRGCLGELPFMPEMLPMCGQRAIVFRCLHRLFDYRKTREMRHMDGAVLLVGTVCDGSSHGGCDSACHMIWKSDWLRRVEQPTKTAGLPISSNHRDSPKNLDILKFGTHAPRYACQLTQLKAASYSVGKWSATNFLRPLVSGNVAPAAFVVGWLTHLFNVLQHIRQGVGFPAFDEAAPSSEIPEDIPLQEGDEVIVRSSAEIRATLDDQLIHRGMGFETDMLKYCGLRCNVQAEVKNLIDIVTGEMRTMKTPAYILRDVHFSGERQQFNAQYEPLFWRAAWLRRVGDDRPMDSLMADKKGEISRMKSNDKKDVEGSDVL